MDFALTHKAVNIKDFNIKDIVQYEGKWGKYYNNFPMSFDIETTSMYDEQHNKIAFMYIWMFCVNGKVIYGRTWDEYVSFINTYKSLHKDKHPIIYVHNLAYEFQFMRKLFKWQKGFANDERNLIYGITENNVEYRCSYMLSNMSLEKVGNNLTKYKVAKMVGDLDYSKIRHSTTPLTAEELGYCFNDVLVVCAYIQELIDKYGSIQKLPLTNTGFVRQFIRARCMSKENYRERIRDITIDGEKEYNLLKMAFQGGFTHANILRSNEVIENVHSFDLTSSYPAVMVAERFPMSKGFWVNILTYDDFYEAIKKYCCVFKIKFYNIKLKANVYDTPLSYYKGFQVEGAKKDNGRVLEAKTYACAMTNVDFEVIRNFYDFDDFSVKDMICYHKDYLPKPFIKSVLSLYKDKTELKDIKEKEYEYLHSKSMCNSTFGMCCTDVVRPEISYNDDWVVYEVNSDEEIEKYNKSSSRFLFYGWGVFITAYARRNLFTAIYSLGSDYIYSDTDSVKFTNLEAHKEYFENYNKIITNKLITTCDFYSLDYNLIKPKTIKGVEKPLGVWDYEGEMTFKTLGAKRYMVVKNDKLSFTISGVNKIVGVPYLLKKYNNNIDAIFKAFDEGLTFPKGYSGKLTHTYIDEACDGKVVDYLGNVGEYHEKSFIHLEASEYTLSLDLEYIQMMIEIGKEEK